MATVRRPASDLAEPDTRPVAKILVLLDNFDQRMEKVTRSRVEGAQLAEAEAREGCG